MLWSASASAYISWTKSRMAISSTVTRPGEEVEPTHAGTRLRLAAGDEPAQLRRLVVNGRVCGSRLPRAWSDSGAVMSIPEFDPDGVLVDDSEDDAGADEAGLRDAWGEVIGPDDPEPSDEELPDEPGDDG